jgi:hypothetical protein
MLSSSLTAGKQLVLCSKMGRAAAHLDLQMENVDQGFCSGIRNRARAHEPFMAWQLRAHLSPGFQVWTKCVKLNSTVISTCNVFPSSYAGINPIMTGKHIISKFQSSSAAVANDALLFQVFATILERLPLVTVHGADLGRFRQRMVLNRAKHAREGALTLSYVLYPIHLQHPRVCDCSR